MHHHRQNFAVLCKALVAGALLAACTVNPATGKRQLTSLMLPGQEENDGAHQAEKIDAVYGTKYNGSKLQAYIAEVGSRVAAGSERKDVTYRFSVLDSPAVNAFALPDGHIYVTRGLLALASHEDELAGVLAHEVGHIAARHIAERYSQTVLASMGAAALTVAAGSGASQAFGFGSELLAVQYSRAQETEADALGVRYLARAGYDPLAMARFLEAMGRYQTFQNGTTGQSSFDFFATHPQTADRVAQARTAAATPGVVAKPQAADAYLDRIDGLAYGDGPEQGFIRGQTFYHPIINVAFTAPAGFTLVNTSDRLIVKGPQNSLAVFDGAPNPERLSAADYIHKDWLAGQAASAVEPLTVGGHTAASAAFDSVVNGRPAKIRIVAVQWTPDRFFRFQIAMPKDASQDLVGGLKQMTYSLRPLTKEEKLDLRPYHVAVVTAGPSDTLTAMAKKMALPNTAEGLFSVLNGLNDKTPPVAGQRYKVITQ